MWFICEYMFFEHVHVFTYDIFRERTGMKLAWGCFCFYPFFYLVGIWPLVAGRGGGGGSTDLGVPGAAACAAVFFAGWVLTRGANLQKYYWRHGQVGQQQQQAGQRQTNKKTDEVAAAPSAFLGFFRNTTVPGSGGRLLCGGFWGVARHVNYLGEILQGVGLALPGFLTTGSWLPWLYPLYYAMLFFGRERDDHGSCEKKYGKAWAAYCKIVPYRIVPGVY